jgi:triosephosphate isomerase
MARRRKLVVGNWKMNPATRAEAVRLAEAVRDGWTAREGVEVVVCPPFLWLDAVGRVLAGSAIGLGAQNAHHERSGACTGDVSVPMLVDLGCRHVIVGHSERRQHCGETNATVLGKARSVLDGGLTPIVCVGETLGEREAGATERVVRRQMEESLAGLEPQLARMVLAYEPVWAIGTGRNATPEQAQEVHGFLRSLLAKMAGEEVASAAVLLYGGSVKPENAGELFGCGDVDGALVGGASLSEESFLGIGRRAG